MAVDFERVSQLLEELKTEEAEAVAANEKLLQAQEIAMQAQEAFQREATERKAKIDEIIAALLGEVTPA